MSLSLAQWRFECGHKSRVRHCGQATFLSFGMTATLDLSRFTPLGFTKEDDAVMRVWQVSGGSASNEPVGWKLLRLDEATEAVVTHQKSLAPRAGYKPGDPAMQQMTCQL